MKKIGLIGAMDEEVAIIKEEMTNTNEVTKAGMTFVEGDFYGIKTVAVVSGIARLIWQSAPRFSVMTFM